MCGIAGIVKPKVQEEDIALVRVMMDRIRHRGPDGSGIASTQSFVFGHRRLSIIDLTTGDQPMRSISGDTTITFNGEIYNYKDLRSKLNAKGHSFRTTSDTEVILEGYEEYGDAILNELNGMFAFALFDERRGRLLLARDRLGKKPLLYINDHDTFSFCSELRGLVESRKFDRSVDNEALLEYLTLLYVPGSRSIFKQVKKLPPGHCLVLENGVAKTRQYWDISGIQIDCSLTSGGIRDKLDHLLLDSTSIRLNSDVPIGLFLSGGLDSSAIALLLKRLGATDIKAFTVNFGQPTDEGGIAAKTASALGLSHVLLNVHPRIAEDVTKIIQYYGEPFADSSCIPTYYVAKEAREHVKVVLNGDGGDEVFGGYPRYRRMLIDHYLSRFPALGLDLLSSLPLTHRSFRKLAYNASLFRQMRDAEGVAKYILSNIYFSAAELNRLVPPDESGQIAAATWSTNRLTPLKLATRSKESGSDSVQLAYLFDHLVYLPDDLLVKMDIATMRRGLEARSPFLDYRLVEFALSWPSKLKMNLWRNKIVLRDMLVSRVPSEVLNRKKQGFIPPLTAWLHHTLKAPVNDVLRANSIPFFEPAEVRRVLDDFFSKSDNYWYNAVMAHKVWALFVAVVWYQQFREVDLP